MAVVVPAPPALSGELALFHTTDPLLSNSPVLVFYGPATTIGATTSRIQVHVFTPAGHYSYPRLSVSPNSPLYSAVSNLPREEQGDEVVRGLAFGLKKYFTELSNEVKKRWCAEAKAPSPSALFGDDHVAILASRMAKIENVAEVIEDITRAFGEQTRSWLDVDVVLPSGSIKDGTSDRAAHSDDIDESELLVQRYGRYAELIHCLGDVAFLPTSKLKRARSKPSPLGRSPSFLKPQKENVWKELSELLGTEESYVERMKELYDLSRDVGADLNAANQEQMRQLFPPAIKDIIRVNSEFLAGLRPVIENTEPAAVQDIEATSEQEASAQTTRQEMVDDTQGICAVAECFCDYFPKFTSSYHEYLESHTTSTQLLRSALKSTDSTLAAQLLDVGEQRLSSLLIEPIQRLPRYNLYIDSIVKQLPIRHPAMKLLLKARDIITEICDHEDLSTASMNTIEKLRSRVSGWPTEFPISGRLVTAADFTELTPPYSQDCEGMEGIILVFTEGLVVLEKRGPIATSAKTLLTEIESGQAPVRPHPARSATPQDLRFHRGVQLDSVDCLEAFDGRCLNVLVRGKQDNVAQSFRQSKADSCQSLLLEGFYERKAERLVEEITKAIVEGRFSESEREGSKWEVRASDPGADVASTFSAVFEDSNQDHVSARRTCAPVRILVDIDRHAQRLKAGQSGIRTVVTVSPLKDDQWRLTIDSVDGSASREHVSLTDLGPILRRKLAALVVAQSSIQNADFTTCLLARNAEILQSINLQFKVEEDEASTHSSRRDRARGPISPKKLLSSFLSSTGPGSHPPSFTRSDLPSLSHSDLPRAPSVNQGSSKPSSRDSRPVSKDQPTPKSMASMRSTEQLAGPLKKLDDTLSAYLMALTARKGNIVGRNLKLRATADELAVNELYNSLLEDSAVMDNAGQAPVDVLFAAFEKFLNIAWKEQIGSVLPFSTLRDIQSKAETMFPADFDEYSKSAISSLSTQNQRAFKAIMKLLADLLDGTGNDSDRGILTCAFAEVLVTEGNPHDYIALIDRFVDDPDTYFGEPLEGVCEQVDSSLNPYKRARSANSASITSNTSSLRKKFGFGSLSRENSKSEAESKVASVWRTLSKSTRGDAGPANSVTRGVLHRSQSTDADSHAISSRPGSQDGNRSILCADDSFVSAASSTHNPGLSTIGEHPSFIPTQPPRKKRRSSLSDLKALEVSRQKSPAWSPPSSRHAPSAQKVNVDKSLPNSPIASTPSSKGGSGRFGSPTKEMPRSRLPSSFRKENSPGPVKAYSGAEQRPKSSDSKPDEVVITARPTSNIPTLTPRPVSSPRVSSVAPSTPARGGLAERADAGNIVKKPSPHPEKAIKVSVSAVTETGSPKKLRMQSPQKLRERLQNEQTAMAAAHTSLQDELSKIGDELTSTPSRMGSIAVRGRGNTAEARPMELAQRVLKLEGQLSTQAEEFNARIVAVQSDLANSLVTSENRSKKLDELYREANSENEALYARFNDELSRIAKAVKDGEGVGELKRKLKEAQEDAAKLKRENGRLKRENVGLRAQLKE